MNSQTSIPTLQISKSPTLPSGAAVDDLFYEYFKTRDPKLKNKIAIKNQKLVLFVINKLYNTTYHKSIREDLIQEGNIGLLSAIEGFDPTKGFQFSTYGCVPLTTQILTKRGWKKYNEIIDGDETIGYDNGKSVWTKILNVTKYDDAPLVKFGCKRWNTICTPQHKWLISENKKVSLKPLTEWPSPDEYKWPKLDKIAKKRIRPDVHLVNSAPFVGGNSSLTVDEASLLAWVLSDGSQIGDWRNRNPSGAVIIQKKTKFADEIRNLLIRLNAYNTDVKHGDGGCLSFTVKSKIFREVWKKSGLKNKTFSDLVLELKPKVRKAWFEAWYKAEGTLGKRIISQNRGEKLDAIILTTFLEGYSDVGVSQTDKTAKCRRITWNLLARNPRTSLVIPNGRGEVWCPTTTLGSWTARDVQDNVFLTGNTYWVRQAINNYLSNVEPTIHIPSHIRTAQNKLLRQLKEDNHKFKDLVSGEPILNKKNKYEITNKMLQSIDSAIGSRHVLSLDEPIGSSGDENVSYKDKLIDVKPSMEQKLDMENITEFVRRGLAKLTIRERLVVLLRFGVINPEDVLTLGKLWKQQSEES